MNKIKPYQWIIRCFLAGMSILSACTPNAPYPEAMRKADQCIVQHPDSALAYLSSLDSSIRHEPEETRMYHALLTTKAKDKLYITHTSDSVIKQVVRFYDSYGDADKLMEAYFYMGSVYRDMNNAPQALKSFQLAIDAGEGSKRYDILGRIYQQMGTLLVFQGLYEDAMAPYKASLHYYKKQKDEEGVISAICYIARVYHTTERTDSAAYFYDIAYKKAIGINDISTRNYIFSEVGCFYIRLDKFDLAKKILSKISSTGDQANALLGLGKIYQKALQEDSAKYYFNEAIKSDHLYVKKGAYKALSKMKANEGDYYTALGFAKKSQEVADSINKITKTEIVSQIHSFYNYQHVEKENHKLIKENAVRKVQIHQIILIIIIFISIAIGTTFILKRKKTIAIAQAKKLYQLKEEQYANSQVYLERNQQMVRELEDLVLQTESQKDSLQKQLFQSQKELLEIANQKIQISRNEKELLDLSLKKSDIYHYFHEVQKNENLKISEDKWSELQTAIDTTYSNFTAKLYALYPQLSRLELHICYLIKISIQVKYIALLLGRSTPAITASRIRLYKKMHGTEGTSEIMDKFILDL